MTCPSQLALHGGAPVFPDGPPAWPLADPEVREALERAWSAGSWGRYQGPHTEQLEAALAAFHRVAHVRLCCSGTFAVELALRALQVGNEDEVILAGYDFAGNYRAIESVGARPVLVDVDATGWRITVNALAEAVSVRTRALIISHLHGALADMPALRAWADAQRVAIVEDACQSVGARIGERAAGTWGDVGILSFGGSKLLSAGRGGALLTDRRELLQRAKIYCERGNDAYPLSELQAAVLLPQLRRLPERHHTRRANVARLLAAAAHCPGLRAVSDNPASADPAYYQLGWWYDASACGGHPRDMVIAALRADGVGMDAGFRGFVHRSARRGRIASPLIHSAQAAECTLVLHHPVLLHEADSINRLSEALHKVTETLAQTVPR